MAYRVKREDWNETIGKSSQVQYTYKGAYEAAKVQSRYDSTGLQWLVLDENREVITRFCKGEELR